MKATQKKKYPKRGRSKDTSPTEILPDAVYKVEETSNILRVSKDTMLRIIKNKQIECSDITDSGDYRVTGHAIIEFMESKSVLNKGL